VTYVLPSGFYIGITYFSYVNCSGVTVNSNVGNESPFPPSRDVCAQENSIILTGGDESADVVQSGIDCCV